MAHNEKVFPMGGYSFNGKPEQMLSENILLKITFAA